MRVLIRTDLGRQDGLGHASRMKALAGELAALGGEVAFLSSMPGLSAFVGPTYNVEYTPTHTDDIRQEEWLITRNLGYRSADVLILDKKAYYDEDFLRRLRDRVKVVRIDHPWAEQDTADLLVLPNIHTSPEDLARLTEAFEGQLLVGPEHVLIGDNRDWMDNESGHYVTFSAGGSDPENMLQIFYDATQYMVLRSLPRQIYLMGAMMDHPLRMQEIDEHSVVRRFSHGLLASARLAVLTFGVTVYEAMRWGVPCLTVARTQEDDLAGDRLAERTGATRHLGHKDALMREMLREEITEVWEDVNARRMMATLGRKTIDGRGTTRVAQEIIERFSQR